MVHTITGTVLDVQKFYTKREQQQEIHDWNTFTLHTTAAHITVPLWVRLDKLEHDGIVCSCLTVIHITSMLILKLKKMPSCFHRHKSLPGMDCSPTLHSPHPHPPRQSAFKMSAFKVHLPPASCKSCLSPSSLPTH